MVDFLSYSGRALFCESLMHSPAPDERRENPPDRPEQKQEKRRASVTIPRGDYDWDDVNDVWQRLANAVIIQAKEDWLEATERLQLDPSDEEAKELLLDAEEFFLSEDFLLFSKYDGKTLLHRLQRSAGQPPHGEMTR